MTGVRAEERGAGRAMESTHRLIVYRIVDSPIGELLLAASAEGCSAEPSRCSVGGLLRVAFAAEGFEQVIAGLAQSMGSAQPVGSDKSAGAAQPIGTAQPLGMGRQARTDVSATQGATVVSAKIVEAPQLLESAAAQIDDYFAGRRRRFELEVDFTLSSGFRRTVQMHLPQIPCGSTLTYKELAEAVGSPNAVRAVGTACATNPLPIVVPCHRVVRSDGRLGGYLGGLDAKKFLLDLEGAGIRG